MVLHAVVMIAFVGGIGALLVKGTFVPLIVIALATSALEAVLLYFRLRR